MLIGRKSTERREVEPAEAQRCTFVTSATVEVRLHRGESAVRPTVPFSLPVGRAAQKPPHPPHALAKASLSGAPGKGSSAEQGALLEYFWCLLALEVALTQDTSLRGGSSPQRALQRSPAFPSTSQLSGQRTAGLGDFSLHTDSTTNLSPFSRHLPWCAALPLPSVSLPGTTYFPQAARLHRRHPQD